MSFIPRLLFMGVLVAAGWYGGAKYGAPDFLINQVDAGASKAASSVSSLIGRDGGEAVDESDAAGENMDDSGGDVSSESATASEESANDNSAANNQPASSDGECGGASYYADSLAGRQTASGEPYDPSKYTAAHKTLPFGARLRVSRQDDGRSVDVTVNDRGPFTPGRIIDLSRVAAEDIGLTIDGVTDVCIEEI